MKSASGGALGPTRTGWGVDRLGSGAVGVGDRERTHGERPTGRLEARDPDGQRGHGREELARNPHAQGPMVLAGTALADRLVVKEELSGFERLHLDEAKGPLMVEFLEEAMARP